MAAEFKARQQERQANHDERARSSGSFGEHVGTRLYREAEADVTALIERLERAEKVIEAARKVDADRFENWPKNAGLLNDGSFHELRRQLRIFFATYDEHNQ